MEKLTPENVWRRFEQTGAILDYLNYKALETGGTPFDRENPWDRPGPGPLAGAGPETDPPHRRPGAH